MTVLMKGGSRMKNILIIRHSMLRVLLNTELDFEIINR